jgi:hypothetical protein
MANGKTALIQAKSQAEKRAMVTSAYILWQHPRLHVAPQKKLIESLSMYGYACLLNFGDGLNSIL